MKLRCVDGKVRNFHPAGFHDDFNRWYEADCGECGKQFGVHDTKVLKPIWRNHVCTPREIKGDSNDK